MSYVGIGNRQDYIADFPTQEFSGNSTTTTFTLNFEAVTGAVRVAVDNVLQPADGSSYYVNGNSLTFTSAPASGTNNISVVYLGTVRNISSVSDNAITAAKLNSAAITGQTAETSVADDDLVLIYDDSATALRKMTKSNFTSGLATTSGTMGVLINTTSFSAVASQAINSVFSSTYENYRFILNLTAATADANLLLKLRNGVTDKSTNYIRANFGRQSTSGGVVSSSGTTTGFNLDSVDSTATYSSYSGDILNPFNSKKTIALVSMINLASDNQNYHQNIFSLQTEDYSADGLNLIADAGAITGTISIYGYNK